MENFSTLRIISSPEKLAKFIDELTSNLKNGWIRDLQKELESNQKNKTNLLRFEYIQEKDCPSSILWLDRQGERELKVSNITFLSKHEPLRENLYNKILKDFYKNLVLPIAEKNNIEVFFKESEVDINNFNFKVAEAFTCFEVGANKATGILHPDDNLAWNKFVIAAHFNNCLLDGYDLQKILEDKGWASDIAVEISGFYELSRKLLSLYDKTPHAEG